MHATPAESNSKSREVCPAMSSLLGKIAPSFTSPAIDENGHIIQAFDFKKYAHGHKCLLFFYPLDFTFVCPSELVALDRRIDEFKQRSCRVISVSIDSHFTHLAWRNTPAHDGGVGKLRFPMVSDVKKEICNLYGVLNGDGVAFRFSFILDSNSVIRHITANDLPFGRSVDESLRILDAIDQNELYGEVCPSDWAPGRSSMKATLEGVREYMKKIIDA